MAATSLRRSVLYALSFARRSPRRASAERGPASTMGLKEDLETDVRDIFNAQWSTRDGTVVPEADELRLSNDAVNFAEAVVLYADLAESTALVDGRADWFAAEVYKTFLHCASKIIRSMNGEITAFD